MKSCYNTNNSALNGGCIYGLLSSIKVDSSSFNLNKAELGGGAIDIITNEMTI